MEFVATVNQIKKVMANASNASKPMGAGHLQFNSSKEYQPEEFEPKYSTHGSSASLDYVGGRMVKLALFCNESWSSNSEKKLWSVTDSAPQSDYQSWNYKYPTYKALLESAGINLEEKLN